MERRVRRLLGFIFTALVLILLVLWTSFWILLVFLPLFYDLFISRKIDWTLRRYGLPGVVQAALEWLAVILLAIVISFSAKVLLVEAYKIPTPSMEATLLAGDYIFVSKLAYGPRLPETPLSIPFFHNKLPSGRRSYSERIKLPYRRLKGISRVKRGDIIVFNFPEGDTMVVQYPGQNYYSLVRQYGRDYIQSRFDLINHPVDKRENYVKRCVGLPGDTLQIIDGEVRINGKVRPPIPTQKFKYYVTTNGEPLGEDILDSLKIPRSSVSYNPVNSLHVLFLEEKYVESLRYHPSVRSIQRYVEPMLSFQNQEIFPHSAHFRWTGDSFGPIVIPAKGDSVSLDMLNLPLYRRIVDVYEENDLKVQNDQIFINDSLSGYYTFKMDYYFVMGDNHHNSADSRFWGFVPRDHLLGKAVLVWFSVEPDRTVLDGLRKERIFRSIK